MSQADRTRLKAEQIMAGARSAFLETGYGGTSVDDIARRAKVSKPTVYKHFADKEALFVAFVGAECAKHADSVFPVDLQDDDVQSSLVAIARHFLDLVLSPFAQSLFRLAVSETDRFPNVGRAFYDSTIAKSSRRLSQFLSAAVARNTLAIEDVDLAAHQFLELCKADLFYKKVFGIVPDISDAERRRHAEVTVSTFCRIYAPAPG